MTSAHRATQESAETGGAVTAAPADTKTAARSPDRAALLTARASMDLFLSVMRPLPQLTLLLCIVLFRARRATAQQRDQGPHRQVACGSCGMTICIFRTLHLRAHVPGLDVAYVDGRDPVHSTVRVPFMLAWKMQW